MHPDRRATPGGRGERLVPRAPRSGVHFDADDRYRLDGQKLVGLGPSEPGVVYGKDGKIRTCSASQLARQCEKPPVADRPRYRVTAYSISASSSRSR